MDLSTTFGIEVLLARDGFCHFRAGATKKLLFAGGPECAITRRKRGDVGKSFLDYRLRVGQLTKDTNIPEGYELHEQRLDETEVSEGTTVILIDGKRPSEWVKNTRADDVAKWLGLPSKAEALVSWDVFDAVLTPGNVILLMFWRDHLQAELFDNTISLQDGARLRRVRVVRDYGMYDRREAPQYYPDAQGGKTIHS